MPSSIIRTKDKDISSEVPSVYANLMSSNPYRGLTYTKSPWQNFLSKLGFRTQADAWQENMQVQANEYDAAVMEKIQEEQYNDPSAQVARMKNANLNPDLDPSSIDSGSAAQLGEDPSTPMMSSDEEGVVMTVANVCMSAVSSAIGAVQSFQGVTRNALQNSMLRTDRDSQMLDFAGKSLGHIMPLAPLNSVDDDGVEYDWRADVLEGAKLFARKNLSRKDRNRYLNAVQSLWQGPKGESLTYQEFINRIRTRKDYSIESQTFWDESASVLDAVTAPLARAAEQLYKSSQKAAIAENEASLAGSQTEIAYQDELNGQVMAQAQNALNKSEAEKNDTVAILQGAVADIMRSLDEASNDSGLKGTLAQMAKLGISGLYLWLSSQGAPSISRSESTHSSSWDKQGGFVEGGSRSFSLGF